MDKNNSKLMEFITDLRNLFKDEIYDEVSGKRMGGETINFVAALKNSGDLHRLKNYLDGREDYSYTEINTQYLDALYIENPYDFKSFILCLRQDYITVDPAFLNYSLDQKVSEALIKEIQKLNIKSMGYPDLASFEGIVIAINISAVKQLNISLDEYRYIIYKNSIGNYLQIYRSFHENPEKIQDFDWESYDHMRYFGLWYYAMVKVMADVFLSGSDASGFVIHDAGTSVAQFPVMLATLQNEELMGLKVKGVIASDLIMRCEQFAKRYINGFENAKPLSLISCDFLDETKELPEADVSILNDVLEHFPTDEISFHVLERFWNRTQKLLIVHVPQEEVPNAAWGHYISFNKKKLLDWAGRLPGHRLLAEKYSFNESSTYMDAGFLILERI